jgi:hypothetical protein
MRLMLPDWRNSVVTSEAPQARPGQHLGTQTLFTGRAGADEATDNHDEMAYDRTAIYKNTIDKPSDQFSVAFLPTEN